MPVTVTLPGPAPWGFRISGGRDFGKPITVSKVTEHGKAAAGDLRAGDVIVTINGESAAEMLHVEAQNKIKQSPGQLQLEVERCPVPPPSHTNGDTSLERLATRVQDTLRMRDESQGTPRAPDPSLASPIHLPHSARPAGTGTCPGMFCSSWQRRQPGEAKPVWGGPAPLPSARGTGVLAGQGPTARRTPGPGGMPLERGWDGSSSTPLDQPQDARGRPVRPRGQPLAPGLASPFSPPSPAFSCGPAAPFPSRLSASARKPVAGVQKLHVCEKCGGSIATQAVRIQDGRYRHPSCYSCADCGLNLKMRGHFWVGDELFCEKHARLRYQGPPGAPVSPPPLSPHS
ncbi:PDLI2 protein, partial [Onychorhynchus coronatus]|nr:PDLI2 protein [Onychorhynchus coronatus]